MDKTEKQDDSILRQQVEALYWVLVSITKNLERNNIIPKGSTVAVTVKSSLSLNTLADIGVGIAEAISRPEPIHLWNMARLTPVNGSLRSICS